MDRTKLLACAEMNCISFVNNLALSGATREQLGRGRVLSNFWSQISRNALDLAVLDWCHAFGQQNDALHWKKVFPDDEDTFRENMLTSMEVSFDEFKQFREQMKVCRDKDLAHLELRNISMIPAMNKAIHSMVFYYHQIQCAKRELGMHCRDQTLYEWFDSASARFDRDAELAFGATGTPRGPNIPKRRQRCAGPRTDESLASADLTTSEDPSC
ncbi:hypothetical protein [Pseudomonas sp. MH10]|uniref:hypothetical protein n=1 Tax=Pseudomonas sp. MH10 TaxID=3048627 RepID=UPI002AC8F4FF|nr:hypothetical protein [Pseudomonas sp. MH10]MEB0043090.1 hypothetical protein [Pseudomonas sp. MH10]WPX63241.1 hypothetical protein RHM59_20410 [Pseudomonas sp. MH10]